MDISAAKSLLERQSMGNFVKLFSYIYRKQGDLIAKNLRDIGLTGSQSILLIGIHRNPGINQNLLSDVVVIDKAATSRILKNLEDSGYLYKEVDQASRRNFKLYLTPDGEDMVAKSLAIQIAFWDLITRDLTLGDKLQLECAFEKMYLAMML